ncbi:MAG: exodeoxyribonuclease V subunit gamma [Verrucomicrobia bacterium]|nr:exodeoxyribonuclease V subunit gamma [Verrucomicrobiota bacterium]
MPTPGLHLHTSNRLEALVERLVRTVREPAGDPFERETVIVQSTGMERWLRMEIAKRLGVCANFNFSFPRDFAWKAFRAVEAGLAAELPDESPFDPAALTWRVHRLLPKLKEWPGFDAVRHYLAGDDDGRKQFQLARNLAGLLDQYLIYRPEMILRWDAGGRPDDATEFWQSELWRAITGEIGRDHPARLIGKLRDHFAAGRRTGSALLPRLSIFGISALPPFYVELFAALAGQCEIHLFLLQPSEEYWGDVQSAPEKLKALRSAPGAGAAGLHLEGGNRLLGSLGALGRDFLGVLIGATEFDPDADFSEPKGGALLHAIQSDILHLCDGGGEGAKRQLAAGDDSVEIHNCHGALRELEVLRDRMLDWFQRDPELRPRDILVMMPDLERYAPLVAAVFGAAGPGGAHIPFSVADVGARRESHAVGAFLALLNLAGTRLGSASVMALLESAAVRARFDFAEADLPQLREWIEAAGIRWGRDAAHRGQLNLPALAQNTWRTGLDRLLLGCAMRGRGENIFAGILPCDGLEGKTAETLGRFADFAEKLFAVLAELEHARPVDDWMRLLTRLLDDFFAPGEGAEPELQLIRSALAQLRAAARLAASDAPVSLAVVLEALTPMLDADSVHSGFLTGRVTFGALKPMRSVPFKIICLVGMNDGRFPRSDPRHGFDLMTRAPRLGDRSVREDDRYLFLETLLSARARLFISYTGQSIRDNSPAPPSVLVSELLDYARSSFTASDGGDVEKHLCFQHRLQAFHSAYFEKGGRLFSYSAENLRACEALRKPPAAGRFFTTPLAPSAGDDWRTVAVDELAEFFANPSRFLATRRLNLRLARTEAALDEREPFEIAGLGGFQVREALLDATLAGAGRDARRARLRAAGQLPLGSIGDAEFERLADELEPLAAAVAALGAGAPCEPVCVDLALGDFRLTGHLAGVRHRGLLQFRPGKLKGRDLVRAWVRHLVWNALPGGAEERASFVVGLGEEGGVDQRRFRPVADAPAKLRDLLALYARGLCEPLKFFPESALVLHETVKSKKSPLDRARTKWLGGERNRGECEDEYFDLFFRDTDPVDEEFAGLAQSIVAPLLEHLEETP